MSKKTVSILGVNFINTTLDGMVGKLSEHVQKNEKAFVVTANPEIVLHALQDANYKTCIDRADYVTADGIGIVKAAGLLGTPLPGRVTGFDMFMKLLQLANEKSLSIYLLGAQAEVLQLASETIMKQFPKVKIVGSHHGFFDWADDKIPNEIKATKPDFVFVALGLPRQEKWIAANINNFEKGVFMGIGGSFDVLAGTVQRAPEIWQKLNVEWLYRLVKQPSRWRRMLALPHFAMKVVGQKVKRSS
ncbi:glycosyltransferase [Anaerobacillus alkaliphilus]|uniref:N-acetylglucosaminyldiphosphoundecaprenol N-acetyl-beta-D-mannosaminyltransferase n=1 Tax=Anaerobacillus alkaliphilus TaxID=1548597 RepID=A0A4Q0VWJ8_9BACI|nr:WecB/TagA/CpsF family glycosyltransferase [Anaerobacillus alkaliphilus]RXJ02956.1 glycosyltransferase [Anaerobacillus alkaliphilus]